MLRGWCGSKVAEPMLNDSRNGRSPGAHLVMLLDGHQEATDGEPCFGGVRRQEHAELVAADARDDVGLAERRGEEVGGVVEQEIAGRVTVRVVDRLESVDVDEEQDQRRLAPAGDLELVLGAAQESPPVLQRGQVVEAGEIDELLLHLDPVGDVAQRAPAAEQRAGGREHRRRAALEPPVAAVAVDGTRRGHGQVRGSRPKSARRATSPSRSSSCTRLGDVAPDEVGNRGSRGCCSTAGFEYVMVPPADRTRGSTRASSRRSRGTAPRATRSACSARCARRIARRSASWATVWCASARRSGPLLIGQRPGREVEDAERAEDRALVGDERRAGEEPDPARAPRPRRPRSAGSDGRSRRSTNLEQLAAVTTWENRPSSVGTVAAGSSPIPAFTHTRSRPTMPDQRDRRPAQIGGELHELVETLLGWGVQDLVVGEHGERAPPPGPPPAPPCAPHPGRDPGSRPVPGLAPGWGPLACPPRVRPRRACPPFGPPGEIPAFVPAFRPRLPSHTHIVPGNRPETPGKPARAFGDAPPPVGPRRQCGGS